MTIEEMAADIISLIRRYASGSTLISHEARIRRAVDKLKKAHKFTAIEQKWIGRITLISHEARIRRAVDKLKKAHKFTAIEQKWIGRMEKYLMEESVLNVGVIAEDTRFRSAGGFKKIDRIFQHK